MPQTKKQLFALFAITFTIKIALALYFSHLQVCQMPDAKFGYLALNGGDTFSYFGVMDNLLEHGEYYFYNGARNVYAGRMPYYGAPYFFLRLFFDKSAANDIFVAFQIFFDALATILFARLCFSISPVKPAFWIGYAIYFCSFNYFVWSLTLVTESLSLSFLIFFLYFYHCFWKTQKWSDAVSAGIFLALMTVLKPYLVLLYPAFLLGVLYKEKTFDLAGVLSYLRKATILSLPLLILLTPWIARNAIVLKKFVPAQENIYAGYNYSDAYISFTNFAGAWGGGVIFWDAGDAGCYFLLNPSHGCNFTIPEYALTDEYDIEDVERLRQNYLRLQENFSPELEKSVTIEFERLTEIYKQEKPFMYYVGSKFIFIKKLFWHTSNYSLPIHPSFKCYNSFQLLFKVVQFIIYVLALTLGVFGLLKLVYERKISFLFLAVPVIIVIFFAEIRTTELRYVSPVYLILLFGIPISLLALFRVLKVYCYKLRYKNMKPV